MSALPPKADMRRAAGYIRFVRSPTLGSDSKAASGAALGNYGPLGEVLTQGHEFIIAAQEVLS